MVKLLAAATDVPGGVFGTVSPPPQLGSLNQATGAEGIRIFLTNIINIIYVAAGIVFVFMIIFAAFQWITSGGDKEAVAKARARITHAIIGIFLLATSAVILKLIGDITGFTFFTIGSAPLTGVGTGSGGVF